ncbi:MAG: DUF3558 domain-containing protein [Mycobacteriaceae bacterium]|nr:DUF3558 domain-containing protein [Mycobacteriaceae bacterium]
MTVPGCSRTISGAAHRATHQGGVSERGYGYADNRCGLLLDSTIQQVVGADYVVRPYSGAVCQYMLMQASTFIDVTYSWFETGSLDRERRVAQANRAEVIDVEIENRQAFLARRSVTGAGCSATAATIPGVASWWVQIRGDSSTDPCRLAQTLLAKTLASDA